MPDSEATILRRALREALEEIRMLREKIARLEEKNRRLSKKRVREDASLAHYESVNMPTSKPSMFNPRRKKFRKRRGEDISGSPGDRAKVRADGGDGKDCKKRGPPAGHRGISHESKAARPAVHFWMHTMVCECGAALRRTRPLCKMIIDLDPSFIPLFYMAIMERGRCPECHKTICAPAPFPDGSSFGPLLLSVLLTLYDMSDTDEKIANFLYSVFGLKVSPNAVWNARKAIRGYLDRVMIPQIMRAIIACAWVLWDESYFKRGDGHYGYVWVVCTPVAVFVLFAPTRGAAVLTEHFEWLRDKPTVCDGHAAYPHITRTIQRCCRHCLAKAEELAVKNEGVDEERYDILPEFYREVKEIKVLTPLLHMDLSRRAYAIFSTFEDDGVRTYLLNALPGLFTALAHRGMPLHNNGVEQEIRDGTVPQRNARHKLMTAEGRAVFSTLVTFSRTCRKQGISPARAFIECIQGSQMGSL